MDRQSLNKDFEIQELAEKLNSGGYKIGKFITKIDGIAKNIYFVGSASSNINCADKFYFKTGHRWWSKTDMKDIKITMAEYGFQILSFTDYEVTDDRTYPSTVSFFRVNVEEEMDKLMGLELTV